MEQMEQYISPLVLRFVSPDGLITVEGTLFLQRIVRGSLALVVFYAALAFVLVVEFRRGFGWQLMLRERDDLGAWRRFNFHCFWISQLAAGALVTSFMYFLVERTPSLAILYSEDNWFENLTVVVLLSSVALLCRVLLRRGQFINATTSPERVLRVLLGLCASGLFLFALEEISWGQRIFGWNGPEWLAELNFQRETNLHNLAQDRWVGLYYFLALILTLQTGLSLLLRLSGRGSAFVALVLPAPSLLPYAFMFLVVLLCIDQNELVEELFSLFALFYSARLSWGVSHEPLESF